jgi:hypothetical protein
MNRSRGYVAGLIFAGVVVGAMAEPATVSHDDTFTKEGLFKADVSDLKDTQLVAQADVPLVQNQNYLWCGTLQLAWNKAIDLVGEKLHFVNQPPVVELLNQESFTGADLDAASYVAVADFERNNVEDEIRAALEKTFQGAASPELIPAKPEHPGPDDFVAYSYLYKNLAFAKPFEKNDSIDFEGKRVENFGFTRNWKTISPGVFDQVSLYDYKSEDDFIIKLKTKSPEDELILAKVQPGFSLKATIASVLKRLTGSESIPLGDRPILAVPKLNFDLRGDFQELEGLVLQPSPTAKIKSSLVLSKAEQLIRFQLNEAGAILKSEAVIVLMTTSIHEEPPPPKHIMIFNHPFLILLKRTNSAQPYFAMWVGNASLLVPEEKP